MPKSPTVHRPYPIANREKQWASRRAHYREWYNLWLWRDPDSGLRAQALRRCPLCVDCQHEGRLTTATEADHEVPHRGKWELFVALENIVGRCKACHSRKTMTGQ